MKRVIVAVILLIVVTALSGTALLLQQRATTKLVTACDELITVFESGDIEQCRTNAEKLSDELEEDMRWFPFFLRHERIETVFQQAASLPLLIDDNDPADFLSTVAAMRMQLEILMDNEWPTFENIM